MTGPNTLPTGEGVVDWHRDAAAALVHFASEAERVAAGQEPPVDAEFARHPNPLDATRGLHPGWLGFSNKTGLPKTNHPGLHH